MATGISAQRRRLWGSHLWALLLAFQCALWASQTAQAEPGLLAPPDRESGQGALLKPVAVFGNDDRRDLPEDLSALEGKIGMLYEQSTQTLCTAFCVAKDIVATAAHCLFQPKSGRLPDLSQVTFRLNYGNTYQQSGVYGRHTPYTKNYIAVGTTVFNNEPPLSAPRDWALAKLERPICRFGAIRVEGFTAPELVKKSEQNRIFQVAYHWDYKHWQLAYSTPCLIQQDFDQIKWRFIKQHFIDHDQLVLHKCDTGGASSGSPILLQTDPPSAPVAVAINVGTYTRTRILLRKGQVVKKLNPDIIANTAVNGSAFKYVIPELDDQELIASRDDMVKLQAELKTQGLYLGVIDGQLGRGTRTAIINFQTSIGLRPSGLPTEALLSRFNEDRAHPAHMFSNGQGIVTQPEPVQAPAAPTVAVPPPLRRPAHLVPPPRLVRPAFNPFGQ